MLVTLDVLLMSTPSPGGRSYGLVLIDDLTAKSDIYVFGARNQILPVMKEYIGSSERSTTGKICRLFE